MGIQQASIISKIADESLGFLRKRGDFDKADTYANRRRSADWLVKKSPMSPFFQRLGITKGSTVCKAFAHLRNVSFFKAIYYLYVLETYNHGYANSLGGYELIFHDGSFRRKYLRLSHDYYNLRRNLRREIDISAGIDGTESERVQSDFQELLASDAGSYEEYRTKYISICDMVPFVVAAVLKGYGGDSRLAEDCSKNESLIEYELIHFGACRTLLTELHDIDLSGIRAGGDTEVHDWWNASDWNIDRFFGMGHGHWNAEAILWQNETKTDLELMQCWQLLGTTNELPSVEEQLMEESEYNDDIFTSGNVGSSDVPAQVLKLAKRLARIHGPVTIAKEASGFHIYIPDPALLETDGIKELNSKHLAINADRYLGIGAYDVDEYPTKENVELYRRFRMKGKEVISSLSMKTKKTYAVSDLLSMRPVSERIDGLDAVRASVTAGSVRKRLVYDENGNQVPEWCGTTVTLPDLEAQNPEHPAILYLKDRGFTDMQKLYDQFEACYCTTALPESRAEDRFYRKLPGSFRNNAECRIVFSVRMHGVREGWQARLVDKKVKVGAIETWHVWMKEQWVHVYTSVNNQKVTNTFPPSENFKHGFDPSKYINATGALRTKLLMGYDAAVEWNSSRPVGRRFCVLVEGPLDAARIGPPAIAILGKSMSQQQAHELKKEFDVIFCIPDTDAAGQEGLRSIIKACAPRHVYEITLPPGIKDAGELTQQQADALFREQILPQVPL